MMPGYKNHQRSATILLSGATQGITMYFPVLIASSFRVSAIGPPPLIAVLAGIAGGLVYGLARYFSEREEWQEADPLHKAEEYRREKEQISKVGIPDELLNVMQQDLDRELKDAGLEPDTGISYETAKKRGLEYGWQSGAGFIIATMVCGAFCWWLWPHLGWAAMVLLALKLVAESSLAFLSDKHRFAISRVLLRSLAMLLAGASLYAMLHWLAY